jgi:hypothetical protein
VAAFVGQSDEPGPPLEIKPLKAGETRDLADIRVKLQP